MPVQQPAQTFTPHEAAQIVGTAAHNVRRWTEYHAAHLSPLATPSPGQARRYNGRDIEVLKHVRSLRAQGLTVAVINEQLAGLTFAEIDTNGFTVTNSEELAPLATQEGLQSTQALIMVVESLQSEVNAIKQANQEASRRRFDTVTVLGIGICIGLLFAVGMIVLASIYGSP